MKVHSLINEFGVHPKNLDWETQQMDLAAWDWLKNV